MRTQIEVKELPLENKLHALLSAIHAGRPQELQFSPWNGGQAIDAMAFTGQLNNLNMGLAQANRQEVSGLR
jgi:hypothetical protein